MNLTYGPEYEEFREEVRVFLVSHADHAPPASVGMGEGGRAGEVRTWQAVLVEHGYTCRTVPKEYGGFGADSDLLKTIIIDEEFRRAGVSSGMHNQGISMFVPTLLRYGTEKQKRSWIGPTIRGELVWCQGYSEPGSGSDLASLSTRAQLDGDEWVINGHKVWTSTAREADMMFALVRTEPEASKHKGISYLVLSMDSPGLDVRPLKMMTGHSGFNEVFFDDVRTPRENMIGERGQGWEVGKATLIHERNFLGSADHSANTLDQCFSVMRDYGAAADPVLRDRAMKISARTLAMKYHALRMLTDKLEGRSSGGAALITKLNGCQLNHDICKLSIDAMNEGGLLSAGSPNVRDEGRWQAEYMFQLGLIIGGGTAQIQKNIISEIGLGMPREPRAQPVAAAAGARAAAPPAPLPAGSPAEAPADLSGKA